MDKAATTQDPATKQTNQLSDVSIDELIRHLKQDLGEQMKKLQEDFRERTGELVSEKKALELHTQQKIEKFIEDVSKIREKVDERYNGLANDFRDVRDNQAQQRTELDKEVLARQEVEQKLRFLKRLVVGAAALVMLGLGIEWFKMPGIAHEAASKELERLVNGELGDKAREAATQEAKRVAQEVVKDTVPRIAEQEAQTELKRQMPAHLDSVREPFVAAAAEARNELAQLKVQISGVQKTADARREELAKLCAGCASSLQEIKGILESVGRRSAPFQRAAQIDALKELETSGWQMIPPKQDQRWSISAKDRRPADLGVLFRVVDELLFDFHLMLDLTHVDVIKLDILKLPQIRGLERLFLKGALNDEVAKYLMGFAGLRDLRISPGSVTPKGLELLRQIPKLEVLIIDGKRIDLLRKQAP